MPAKKKSTDRGALSRFFDLCREESERQVAFVRSLEIAQDAALKRGDEEEAERLALQIQEAVKALADPARTLWEKPLKARDEAFELLLAFFGKGKFFETVSYCSDPKLRFCDKAKLVPLTPEEIRALPEQSWEGYSERTLAYLEKVRLMNAGAAFQFGFTIGLIAGEAQASEYLPAAGAVDGPRGAIAAMAKRPDAYIRKAVLEIAREEGITAPARLRAHLARNPHLGYKCTGDSKNGWTYSDRDAPAPKGKNEKPIEFKVKQTQIHKLLKGNIPATE